MTECGRSVRVLMMEPLLVGDAQRSTLATAVASMVAGAEPAGRRVIATIVGDAGHGKSTVLREVARRLDEAGRSVVALRGATPDHGIPYAGVHRLLTSALVDGSPPDHRPTLIRRLDVATRPGSPLAVASLMERWFVDRADDRSVVVAIDDADLVDEDSVRVLAFVASRLPPGRLSIVATLTHDVPLIERIGPIRFELDDLARDTALAIAAACGLPRVQGGSMVDRLGGNPLALRHAGEALAGALETPNDDEPIALAHRLSQYLDDCADKLTPDTVRLLETAAITRETRVHVLAEWSRARGCCEFDDLVNAAEDAGLVECGVLQLRWRRAWMAEGFASRCPVGRRHRTMDRWRPTTIDLRSTPSLPPGVVADRRRSLSPAERRVVEVIVGGASTRAAATDLHLSEKTVESHLQSVYRKLAVHSRSQLAAAMHFHDDRRAPRHVEELREPTV